MAKEAQLNLYEKKIPQLIESTSSVEQMKKITNKSIIFVLGGPGSGKGTHCARIAEDFRFLHLSAGELLRKEVDRGTPQGLQLQEAMRQGQLVPPEMMISLLKAAMLAEPEAVGYLIDGFPRELPQIKMFAQQVCECSFVLIFECPEEVMVRRLLKRGQTSGRVDDNEDTIRKRLHIFTKSTLPVIEYYKQLDKCKIVNSDRVLDNVYGDVSKIIAELTMTD